MAPEEEDVAGEIGGVASQDAPSSEATVAGASMTHAVGSAEPDAPASQGSDLPTEPGADETGSAPTGGSSSSAACPYPNYPSTHWSPTIWEPYDAQGSPVAPDGSSLLRNTRATMVGRWYGRVTTPWTTPYEVEVTFDADGHYSARCAEPALSECCRAFYYGTDDDTPLKQWRVNEATLSGEVSGQIDIAFDYPTETSVEYGLPAWQGVLSKIERNAAGDGLRFEFATSSGYGPVRYDLRRGE